MDVRWKVDKEWYKHFTFIYPSRTWTEKNTYARTLLTSKLTTEDSDLCALHQQVGGSTRVDSAVVELGVPYLQDAYNRFVGQRHKLLDKCLL